MRFATIIFIADLASETITPQLFRLQTIQTSMNTRFVYYVCESMYYGSIYAKLSDNTVSDSVFVEGKTAEEAYEYMRASQNGKMIAFWIFWTLFIAASVFGFFVLDNDWIED